MRTHCWPGMEICFQSWKDDEGDGRGTLIEPIWRSGSTVLKSLATWKEAAGKIATRMNNAKLCRLPENGNDYCVKVFRWHKINDDDNDAKIVSIKNIAK